MLDRLKIESILRCRFPGATLAQVAGAANAIMGLSDEWQELVDADYECGTVHMPVMLDGGAEVRVFRRRSGAVSRASRDNSVKPGLGDLGGDDIQPGDRQDRAHQPCGDRNKSEDLDEREIGKCDGERDKRHR